MVEKRRSTDTIVNVNLKVVLYFVMVAFIAGFSFLFASDVQTKTKQQEIVERVTKIETQYQFIITGLANVVTAVETHRNKTELGRNGNNVR